MSKKQFRIGDLAKELKVKKFVIRFWEKEFGIKSDRSGGGQRFYSADDLKMFLLIKDLLYGQGFTIAGAKKQLDSFEKSGASLPDAENIAVKIQGAVQDTEHTEREQTVQHEHALCAPTVEIDSEDQDDQDTDLLPEYFQSATAVVTQDMQKQAPPVCACSDLHEKFSALKTQLLELKTLLEKSVGE